MSNGIKKNALWVFLHGMLNWLLAWQMSGLSLALYFRDLCSRFIASQIVTCVESNIFKKLYPARMGYGNCWFYPSLDASQDLSPNGISPQIYTGSCRQCGATLSPSPLFPPKRKKSKTKQKQRELQGKHYPAPSPGDGLPLASPL